MKKRSSRSGDLRHRERRFSDREVSRGEDDENLATRTGRPMRLPLADEEGAVAEEIEGNALADGMAWLVDTLRPHLRAIGLGLAGLLLAVVAWMWMRQQQTALEAAGWNDYVSASQSMDDAKLADVVTRNPGAPAAAWALLVRAETSLDEGSRLLFVDRGQATPKLQAAAEMYSEVLGGRPSGLLAERATFGLAKANECLGRLTEALAGYEAVVSDHPRGLLAEPARQRTAALSSPAAAEWYEWFAAQRMTPPPAPRDDTPILGLPGDGAPPTAPAGEPASPAAGAAATPAPAAEGAPAAEPPRQE